MKRIVAALIIGAALVWGGNAWALYPGPLPLGVPGGGSGASTFTAHGVLIGEGASAFDVTAVGTNGQMLLGATGADPGWQTMSGDATLGTTGALTLATVNSNVGSFTNASITVNAKGLITAASTGSSGASYSYVSYTTSNATVTLASTNLQYTEFNQSGTKVATIDLPTSPSAGLTVCFKDDGNGWATSPPIVKTTDSSTLDDGSGSTGYQLPAISHFAMCWGYNSTNTNWNAL